MLDLLNNRTRKLVAALTGFAVMNLIVPLTVWAQALPNVDPNTRGTGTREAGRGLNWFAGIMVFVCLFYIVKGFGGMAGAIKKGGGHGDDGIKVPATQFGLALVGLILLYNFNTFVNGAINDLGR